jgi:hypothetical protein
VNGVAWAGGFLLAQCCDLCIAADTATFAISEVTVGRGAPWAAPLSWLIPPRIALQILLTGDPLTARRAYEIGLVNDVVPLADLRARTQQVAMRIAANAPLSVLAAKRTAYLSRPDLFDEAERIWAPVYHSVDAQEGPAAFRDKRPPVWTGRCAWYGSAAGLRWRISPDLPALPRRASYRVASSRVEQVGCRSWPRSRVMGRMACCHSQDTFSAMWPSCSSARRISAALFGRSAW